MTTMINGVHKLVDGLINPRKGGDPDGPEAQNTPDGPDTMTPPSKTDRGNHTGWQHDPGDVHDRGNGRQTGGPSLPEPGGLKTGGPAPQGMQDVFPNIAQQLASSLSSVVNSANSLASNLATPAHVPGPPAHAADNAHAAPGMANARAQGQALGNTPAGLATPQAAPGTAAMIASATPTTAATSQAAMSSGVANPAASTLAQPATTLPRAVGDTTVLAQNRAAETALPPRPENVSLLNRLATALQLAPAPPTTTLPTATLPAPPPGTTQAMATAAGLTMATSAVNQPVDARGAILATNDHAAMRAADATLGLAGHTLDGLQRRLLRNRVQMMPQRLTRLLWAMGLMGAQTDARDANPERDLQRAMQWLFWMLAVIAYGCLAVAIVALVGSNGRMFDYEAGRTYTSWLAFFGLVTGTVAWLLARRMSRRR